MKHPEVLLLPVLMISDYVLTVFGFRLRSSYSDHFGVKDYELNPIWQKAIARKRWVNFKHLAITLLVTGGVVFVAEGGADERALWMVEGALFVVFGMINGRHISNILTFLYTQRHPSELVGQIRISHRYQLAMSQFQLLIVFLPLAMIAVFTRHPFAIGGATGLLVLGLVHCLWMFIAHLRGRRAADGGCCS